MLRFIGRFLIAFCLFANAYACLNSYSSDEFQFILDGHRRKPPAEELENRERELEAAYTQNYSLESANDYAVALVFSGKYSKAIDILKGLEARYPGQFRTAANLGTALELAGDNEKALHWIKEGIKRNPEDHGGTEWLHVKILEAKLAIAQNKDWLRTHRVLGVDFGDGYLPNDSSVVIKDHLGNVRTQAEAKRAIEYQLRERLKFVAPPDAVVADLFFAVGDLPQSELPSRSIYDSPARDYYQTALEYGVTPHDIVKKRLLWIEAGIWGQTIAWWGLAILVLVGIPVWFLKRRFARRKQAGTTTPSKA